MQQAHVFISGWVQGVGFRRFLRHSARKLGITGWTQNLEDGRVEAVFQAKDKLTLERMIKEAHRGPILSQVDNIVLEWEDCEDIFQDFQIRK